MTTEPARVTLIADLTPAQSVALLAMMERRYGTALFEFKLVEWITGHRSVYELTCNLTKEEIVKEFMAFAAGYVEAMRTVFVYEEDNNWSQEYGIIFAPTAPAAEKIVKAHMVKHDNGRGSVTIDPVKFADDGRGYVYEHTEDVE